MAQVKFIILVTLVIFFKFRKGNITNTLSTPVFEDPDLVNYNIDKLFKAIKDKYLPITIISINSKIYIYSSTQTIVGQYKTIIGQYKTIFKYKI